MEIYILHIKLIEQSKAILCGLQRTQFQWERQRDSRSSFSPHPLHRYPLHDHHVAPEPKCETKKES